MFHAMPLNSEYVEFTGAGGYAQLSGYAGFNDTPRRTAIMLDLTVMDHSAHDLTDVLLFGRLGVGAYLTLDVPPAGGGVALQGTFLCVRNVTTKSVNFGINYGERAIVYATDDGATIRAYVNGIVEGSTTWTAAQGSYPLTTNTNPIVLANDASASCKTRMRLHELMCVSNDVLVSHIRPKLWHQGKGRIADLSPFGNDLVLQGVEETDYRIRSAWIEGRAFSGKENVR